MIEGRITKGIGGLYFVSTSEGVFECSVRGVFRKEKIVPTVGDYVAIQKDLLKENKASIVKIHKRKNELIRPKVNNVDQVIIVFSSTKPKINLDLLDKFIILSEEKNLEIYICINKMDLIDTDTIEVIEDVYRAIGYKIIYCDIKNEDSIKNIKQCLNNKISVFAGSSGVGKSSIINLLIPSAKMETDVLSKKIDRGKHTTRHAQLLELNQCSFILDTPGFSSIDLNYIGYRELKHLFKEFRHLNDKCKYSDCNHLEEPGCCVKEQIGSSINEDRYNRYKKIYLELKSKKVQF
jgi:ribosome biogenesis GTPase / thiamine phosphate phosphatase